MALELVAQVIHKDLECLPSEGFRPDSRSSLRHQPSKVCRYKDSRRTAQVDAWCIFGRSTGTDQNTNRKLATKEIYSSTKRLFYNLEVVHFRGYLTPGQNSRKQAPQRRISSWGRSQCLGVTIATPGMNSTSCSCCSPRALSSKQPHRGSVLQNTVQAL